MYIYMVKRKPKLDRMNLLVPSPSHSIFLLTETRLIESQASRFLVFLLS